MIYKQKLITLMTIFSFMSIGWGQDCGNQIEIDSIEDICNLTDLTEINLSSNGLTGEIPSWKGTYKDGNLINGGLVK